MILRRKTLSSVITGLALGLSSQAGFAQSDSNLAAIWDFESGVSGTNFKTVASEGECTVKNCRDEIGGAYQITTKNAFFQSKYKKPSLSVVDVVEENIPPFSGNHVLKSTVFNDRLGYVDWCKQYTKEVAKCAELGYSQTKGRIDPAVPVQSFSVKNGQSAWIGFAMYIPSDYKFETLGWGVENIMELQYRSNFPKGKGPGDSKGGPFGMEIGNAKLHIHADYSPGTNYSDDDKDAVRLRKEFPLEKGKWYSIVSHVKFDVSGKGFAQVWINGKKVMDETNINLGYQGFGDALTGLDVMTLYKHNWWLKEANTTVTPAMQKFRSLYFDALRVAPVNTGSKDMVDPEKFRSVPVNTSSDPVPNMSCEKADTAITNGLAQGWYKYTVTDPNDWNYKITVKNGYCISTNKKLASDPVPGMGCAKAQTAIGNGIGGGWYKHHETDPTQWNHKITVKNAYCLMSK